MELARQPTVGGDRDLQGQYPAAVAVEPALGRRAHDLAAMGIGDDEPAIDRQDLAREVGLDREEEAVAELEIFRPFPIGLEIGAAGLHLDDDYLAGRVERDHIVAAP